MSTIGGENTTAQLPLVALAAELQLPMAYIGGASKVLLDDVSAPLSASQKEQLQRILHSSDRSVRMLRALVDVYTVRQSEIALALEPVNVHQVLEEVAHQLTPIGKQLQRPIEVRISRKSSLVVAHRAFLENAIFAIMDGALRQSHYSGAVQVASRVHDEQTRLSVTDTGERMSMADFRQLEQRLGHEVQPLQAQAGSSGIGLYVARQLVEAMHGRMGLERKTIGTGVYIDLFSSRQLSII